MVNLKRKNIFMILGFCLLLGAEVAGATVLNSDQEVIHDVIPQENSIELESNSSNRTRKGFTKDKPLSRRIVKERKPCYVSKTASFEWGYTLLALFCGVLGVIIYRKQLSKKGTGNK